MTEGKDKKEFKGVIFGHFETGCEGYMWVFYEDGKEGYDGLKNLEAGDHLTIFNNDGLEIFSEIIKPDHEIGKQVIPLNPEYSQPTALGLWIHWTQDGFLPDDWAKLFFQKPPFRATLRKK
ncbi:MAG: hypothetical protein L3J07_03720 [Candidatus Magasanikbacteria bacterium]|nr:hypothetical protein [Candidatus Magasanikbacteria bacterium]